MTTSDEKYIIYSDPEARRVCPCCGQPTYSPYSEQCQNRHCGYASHDNAYMLEESPPAPEDPDAQSPEYRTALEAKTCNCQSAPAPEPEPEPEPEPPIKKRVSIVTTIEIDWGDETGELEVHTSSIYRDEDTFISEFTSALDGMEGEQRIYSHSEDAALAMHGVLVARGVAYATREAQRLAAEAATAIEAMPLGGSLLADDYDLE